MKYNYSNGKRNQMLTPEKKMCELNDTDTNQEFLKTFQITLMTMLLN